MKIAFDITRSLEEKKTGIGTYQQELFRALTDVSKNKHTIYPLSLSSKVYKHNPGVYYIENPFLYSRLFLKNTYDRIKIIPQLKKSNTDLFHFTAYVAVKGLEHISVATIHDVIFIKDKRHYNPYFHKRLQGHIDKFAGIIAVSETTKQEILEVFPKVKETRIKVIYEGVSDNIKAVDNNSVLRFKEEVLGNKDISYILYLGSFTARKNVVSLIKAFAYLIKRHKIEHNLVLAGKPLDSYDECISTIEELGIDEKVKLIPYIESKYICHLLSGADIFVFPSYYEGFGLPVLEAMRCGIACVVSNVSSLKELFSRVAFTIDPYNIDDISNGIYNLLADVEKRKEYAQKGYDYARRFRWENTAKETIKFYKDILDKL